jgi:hypothetical protein
VVLRTEFILFMVRRRPSRALFRVTMIAPKGSLPNPAFLALNPPSTPPSFLKPRAANPQPSGFPFRGWPSTESGPNQTDYSSYERFITWAQGANLSVWGPQVTWDDTNNGIPLWVQQQVSNGVGRLTGFVTGLPTRVSVRNNTSLFKPDLNPDLLSGVKSEF